MKEGISLEKLASRKGRVLFDTCVLSSPRYYELFNGDFFLTKLKNMSDSSLRYLPFVLNGARFYTTNGVFGEILNGFESWRKEYTKELEIINIVHYGELQLIKSFVENRKVARLDNKAESRFYSRFRDKYNKYFDKNNLSRVDKDLLSKSLAWAAAEKKVAIVSNDLRLIEAGVKIAEEFGIRKSKFSLFNRRLFDNYIEIN